MWVFTNMGFLTKEVPKTVCVVEEMRLRGEGARLGAGRDIKPYP